MAWSFTPKPPGLPMKMQSYFQSRRICKKPQKQHVTKYEDSEYLWTHEKRYWYFPGGGLVPESCDPHEGAAAQRRREHGHRTWVGGPAFEAHTAHSHLDRDGDVERADMDPEFNVDPYTINSRDTIECEVDIVVTGVERVRYADQGEDESIEGAVYHAPRVRADEVVDETGEEEERVYIVTYYAMMLELAATVAPVSGSFIVMATSVSWRWVDWATNILAGILLVLVVLFLPETDSPILLRWKAQQLRCLTGDNRYRGPLEFKKVALRRRLRNALSRPIIFFWTEAIIVVFSLYMSIVFIILYTSLQALPQSSRITMGLIKAKQVFVFSQSLWELYSPFFLSHSQ